MSRAQILQWHIAGSRWRSGISPTFTEGPHRRHPRKAEGESGRPAPPASASRIWVDGLDASGDFKLILQFCCTIVLLKCCQSNDGATFSIDRGGRVVNLPPSTIDPSASGDKAVAFCAGQLPTVLAARSSLTTSMSSEKHWIHSPCFSTVFQVQNSNSESG